MATRQIWFSLLLLLLCSPVILSKAMGTMCAEQSGSPVCNKFDSADIQAKLHTSDRSDRSPSRSSTTYTDPNLSLRHVVEDLCSTDPTQEACPRSCRFYGWVPDLHSTVQVHPRKHVLHRADNAAAPHPAA